jgi:succinoglycan biosynthesis protein ExoA
MPDRERIQVSVVVPCRNEIRFIRGFLESIADQDIAELNVEVLIADGMSNDGTRQVLGEYEQNCPALRIIDNPGKIASTGLNAAIREARGEVIIRMDVHSEYAPDYIRNCFQILNETGADNVGGPALTRANGYMAQAIAVAFQSKFANGGGKFHDPRYEGYVDTVPYGCWRKSSFDWIGLFEESFVRDQDDELNLRIISTGGKIWQSPRIVSWYRPRASLAAVFRQYFQYGFWKVAVIRKHRKPASWRHLVPGASLACTSALLLGATGGVLVGASRLSFVLLVIWTLLAGLYCAASLGAALIAAGRHGWRYLPILPVVFATYHLSYGLGFLLGLSHHPGDIKPSSPSARIACANDTRLSSGTEWATSTLEQKASGSLKCARETK